MKKGIFTALLVLAAVALAWLAGRQSQSPGKSIRSSGDRSAAAASASAAAAAPGQSRLEVAPSHAAVPGAQPSKERTGNELNWFLTFLQPPSPEEYESLRSKSWIREDVSLEAQGYTKWEQIEQDHSIILSDPSFSAARRIAVALKARGVSDSNVMLHCRQLYADAGNFWEFEASKRSTQETYAQLLNDLPKTGAPPETERALREDLARTLQAELSFQRGVAESARRRLRDLLGINDEELIADIFRERPTEILPSSRP